MKKENLFKRLQAKAGLTNDQVAEYLQRDLSSIGRYRAGEIPDRWVYIMLDNYSVIVVGSYDK